MSTRNTWNIYYKSGTSWIADGTIIRPNENIQLTLLSTATKLRLADGSNAFNTPETKSNKDAIQFTWLEIDHTDALITKINGYITSGNYIKITTHLNEDLIGRFLSASRVWISGTEDTMDYAATMERIE